MARRLEPDVILMDLLMPNMDGITAIARVKAERPETEIVTMTSFIEEDKVTAALEAGASGYVLKDAEAEEVAAAVRAAFAGEVHLDPAVARLLAQRMRQRKSPRGRAGRAADRAREGRPQPARAGDEQQGDRDPPVHHRTDGADLRVEHPGQARARVTHPGRPLRRRAQARRVAREVARSVDRDDQVGALAGGRLDQHLVAHVVADEGTPDRDWTTRSGPATGSDSDAPTIVHVAVSPSCSTVTLEPRPTREPATGASTITAVRRRASSAWTRPSRNDCSSRAAWYSAFSLRSPCSLAVRILAITSGRRTWVSSSSSARRRAAPSTVRSCAPCPAAAAASAASRSRVAAATDRRGADGAEARGLGGASARRRRLAVGALRVAVRDHDHPGRRWWRFDRLGDQRAGHAGRLALAGSLAAGWRTGSTTPGSGSAGSLGVGHAGGEGVQQGVLVLLGGGRRGPPDPGAVEAPQDLEPVPAGIRPPVAELGRGDRGQPAAHGGLRGADVQDRLRRQPEGREPRGEGLRRRAAPRRAAASRPARSTCRPGSARSGRSAGERAAPRRRRPGPEPGRAGPIGPDRRPSGRPNGAGPGQSCRSSSADGTRGRSEVSCGQHAAPHPSRETGRPPAAPRRRAGRRRGRRLGGAGCPD